MSVRRIQREIDKFLASEPPFIYLFDIMDDYGKSRSKFTDLDQILAIVMYIGDSECSIMIKYDHHYPFHPPDVIISDELIETKLDLKVDVMRDLSQLLLNIYVAILDRNEKVVIIEESEKEKVKINDDED